MARELGVAPKGEGEEQATQEPHNLLRGPWDHGKEGAKLVHNCFKAYTLDLLICGIEEFGMGLLDEVRDLLLDGLGGLSVGGVDVEDVQMGVVEEEVLEDLFLHAWVHGHCCLADFASVGAVRGVERLQDVAEEAGDVGGHLGVLLVQNDGLIDEPCSFNLTQDLQRGAVERLQGVCQGDLWFIEKLYNLYIGFPIGKVSSKKVLKVIENLFLF